MLAGQPNFQLVAHIDRLRESQVVEPVIRQHRSKIRLHEQPGRHRYDKIAVCDTCFEKRVFRSQLVIHVRIEFVAAEFGKILDILYRYFSRCGVVRVADLKFFEVFCKRMRLIDMLFAAAYPASRYLAERRWRPLQGSALHVMQYAAYASHFLPATGPAGPAMHQVRQRRTVAGGFTGRIAIDDYQATVIRRDAQRQRLRNFIVTREYRTGQAALTHPRQGNGLVQRVVGHNRADRPKRFDAVHRPAGQRFLTMQQNGREKSAFLGIGIDQLEILQIAINNVCVTAEFGYPLPDFVTLAQAGERAHLDFLVGRVADADLAERPGQCADQFTAELGGRDYPAYRGTFLTGFHGHLTNHFLDI